MGWRYGKRDISVCRGIGGSWCIGRRRGWGSGLASRSGVCLCLAFDRLFRHCVCERDMRDVQLETVIAELRVRRGRRACIECESAPKRAFLGGSDKERSHVNVPLRDEEDEGERGTRRSGYHAGRAVLTFWESAFADEEVVGCRLQRSVCRSATWGERCRGAGCCRCGGRAELRDRRRMVSDSGRRRATNS